jgi:ribosomal protein L18E
VHNIQNEAVAMFARYCRARFGKNAVHTVRERARALRKQGDVEGHDVWNRVADEIEKTKSQRAH